MRFKHTTRGVPKDPPVQTLDAFHQDATKYAKPTGGISAPAMFLMSVLVLAGVAIGIAAAATNGFRGAPASSPATTSAPTTAPTPAPTFAPAPDTSDYTYLTTTPFLYDVNAYELWDYEYEDKTYVVMKWRDRGHLYHTNGSFYQTVEECPTEICTLVVRMQTYGAIEVVLRFYDVVVHRAYSTAAQVVLVGQGWVGDEWAVPDARSASAAVIRRNYTHVAGVVIAYERVNMTYETSALIMPGGGSDSVDESSFWINEGFADADYTGVAFRGSCTGDWIVTPQLANHSSDDSQDRTVSCDRYQAVVVLHSGSTIQAVWFVSADDSEWLISVNVARKSSYVYVYGAYVADVDGPSADEFVLPFFSLEPVPGAVPPATSPPGVDLVAWTSGWLTGFVARYDATTLEYDVYLRFESATNRVLLGFGSDRFAVFGETVSFDALGVYDSSDVESEAVDTLVDEETSVLSPVGCEYSLSIGKLIRCYMYRGTSETHLARMFRTTPITASVTEGTLQYSNAWVLNDPAFSFVGRPVVNITGVDASHSKSTYASHTSALLPNDADATEMLGAFTVTINVDVWFADAEGAIADN